MIAGTIAVGKLEFTLIGETVSVASRVEKLRIRDEVLQALVDPQTRPVCACSSTVPATGMLSLSGMSGRRPTDD